MVARPVRYFLVVGESHKVEPVKKRDRLPTRDDVAELAGVSAAVVSYVVNDGPRPVAADTRARVLAAIKELGYRPNQLARGLKARQSLSVGLIVPSLTNTIYSEIALGLKDSLLSEGYSLFLCETEDDAEHALRFAVALDAKRVDGAIIIPTDEPDRLIDTFAAGATPLVVLEYAARGTPSIVIDEILGGRLAAQHLLDLGHTRLAVVRGATTARTSSKRIDGAKGALGESGIELDPDLVGEVADHFDLAEAENVAMRILDRADPPTGVLSHNDMIAMTVISAARKLGMSVPEDLSVVGYDDIALAAFTSPPLTTVKLQKRDLGRLAGNMLRDQMIGEMVSPPVTTLRPELVVRESTGPIR